MDQGIASLEMLQNQLSTRDLVLRQIPFDRARRFMLNAATGGGVGPTKVSFVAPGTRDIRVDIEVQAGIAFVP